MGCVGQFEPGAEKGRGHEKMSSEMSKRITITRQISRLSTISSIAVRWSLVIYNKKI